MLTFAFCTFNRCDRLEKLVAAMRAQTSKVPFEILAINNNSSDATAEVLERLSKVEGPPLRWVTEQAQGIVPARNRAIAESIDNEILVFIDDDELPEPGMLEAAADAILNEGADCVGGPIRIDFEPFGRPAWLDSDIAAFLGALDHGPQRLWVEDESTPVWSGNVAYRMEIFRRAPELRFDMRYNREGAGIGGGSDAIMFRALVSRKARIRYRPDMVIRHLIDEWKLQRRYFLRLHYRAGLRRGRYQMPEYPRTMLGVPPFLVVQYLRQMIKALGMQVCGRPGALRHGMNAANTLGCLIGYSRRATT